MSILDRASDALRQRVAEAVAGDRIVRLQQRIDEQEVEIQRLTWERDNQARVSAERLGVIYSLQDQRDVWRRSMEVGVREHMTAQVMLIKDVRRAREVAIRCLHLLNQERKAQGKEPIQGDQDLPAVDDAPSEAAAEFAIRMKKLHDSMPEPIALPRGPDPVA